MIDATSGEQITHVIMFSGGIQSYVAAKRTAARIPLHRCRLLFCDTRMEDPDCYRFIAEASAKLKIPLITIAEGRTPWQVFHDERYLGSWAKDPCSKKLKRQLARRWMTAHFPSPDTTIIIGFDHTESHRWHRSRHAWFPYNVAFPLVYPPLISKCQMLAATLADGLRPQRLYQLGFTHSNCGGFCCKAGLAHYRHLLKTMPEVYAYHEQKEQDLQAELQRPVTFLTLQDNAKKQRISMRDYRRLIENGRPPNPYDDWGGCDCFSPIADD